MKGEFERAVSCLLLGSLAESVKEFDLRTIQRVEIALSKSRIGSHSKSSGMNWTTPEDSWESAPAPVEFDTSDRRDGCTVVVCAAAGSTASSAAPHRVAGGVPLYSREIGGRRRRHEVLARLSARLLLGPRQGI